MSGNKCHVLYDLSIELTVKDRGVLISVEFYWLLLIVSHIENLLAFHLRITSQTKRKRFEKIIFCPNYCSTSPILRKDHHHLLHMHLANASRDLESYVVQALLQFLS